MKNICSLIIAFFTLLSVNKVDAQSQTKDTKQGMAVTPGFLPLKLTDFSATLNNNTAVLTWTTQQEINSSKFIIEKSSSDSNWQAIGVVRAAGISSTPSVYYYADENVLGTTYYRIMQVDANGVYDYSSVINISSNQTNDFSIKMLTVKNTNTATISTISNVNKTVAVKVYDNNAVLVKELTIELAPGINNIEIASLNTLAAGMYTVIAYDFANSQAAATRFTKQ